MSIYQMQTAEDIRILTFVNKHPNPVDIYWVMEHTVSAKSLPGREGVVTDMLVRPGDMVSARQDILTVQIPGGHRNIEAAADGILVGYTCRMGDSIEVDTPLAVIEEDGERRHCLLQPEDRYEQGSPKGCLWRVRDHITQMLLKTVRADLSKTVNIESAGKHTLSTNSEIQVTENLLSEKPPHALSFDGNDTVFVKDGLGLRLQKHWTLEAWVYRYREGEAHPIVTKADEKLTGYSMRIGADNRLQGGIMLGENFVYAEGKTEIKARRWTHIAVTFDADQYNKADAGDCGIKCYVNGREEPTKLLRPLDFSRQSVGKYFYGVKDMILRSGDRLFKLINFDDGMHISPFTIETWLRISAKPKVHAGDPLPTLPKQHTPILAYKVYGQGGEKNAFWQLGYNEKRLYARFGWKDEDSINHTTVAVEVGKGWQPDRWMHVSLKVRSSGTPELWINFQKIGETYLPASLPEISGSKDRFFVGGLPHGDSSFCGDLCELRIWKGLRSSCDLEALSHRRLNDHQKDLMAYYPFGEVSLDLGARDGAGNHFDLRVPAKVPTKAYDLSQGSFRAYLTDEVKPWMYPWQGRSGGDKEPASENAVTFETLFYCRETHMRDRQGWRSLFCIDQESGKVQSYRDGVKEAHKEDWNPLIHVFLDPEDFLSLSLKISSMYGNVNLKLRSSAPIMAKTWYNLAISLTANAKNHLNIDFHCLAAPLDGGETIEIKETRNLFYEWKHFFQGNHLVLHFGRAGSYKAPNKREKSPSFVGFNGAITHFRIWRSILDETHRKRSLNAQGVVQSRDLLAHWPLSDGFEDRGPHKLPTFALTGTEPAKLKTERLCLADTSFTISFWAKQTARDDWNQFLYHDNDLSGHPNQQFSVNINPTARKDPHYPDLTDSPETTRFPKGFSFSFDRNSLEIFPDYQDEHWHHWTVICKMDHQKNWRRSIYYDGIKVGYIETIRYDDGRPSIYYPYGHHNEVLTKDAYAYAGEAPLKCDKFDGEMTGLMVFEEALTEGEVWANMLGKLESKSPKSHSEITFRTSGFVNGPHLLPATCPRPLLKSGMTLAPGVIQQQPHQLSKGLLRLGSCLPNNTEPFSGFRRNDNFAGELASVRLWHVARPPEQIQASLFDRIDPTQWPHLQACWPMVEGKKVDENYDLRDHSVHGNHGYFGGGNAVNYLRIWDKPNFNTGKYYNKPAPPQPDLLLNWDLLNDDEEPNYGDTETLYLGSEFTIELVLHSQKLNIGHKQPGKPEVREQFLAKKDRCWTLKAVTESTDSNKFYVEFNWLQEGRSGHSWGSSRSDSKSFGKTPFHVVLIAEKDKTLPHKIGQLRWFGPGMSNVYQTAFSIARNLAPIQVARQGKPKWCDAQLLLRNGLEPQSSGGSVKVQLPKGIGDFVSHSWTAEAWIFAPSHPHLDESYVILDLEGENRNLQLGLRADKSERGLVHGWKLYSGENKSKVTLEGGRWVHIAVSWEAAGKPPIFFFDGEPSASEPTDPEACEVRDVLTESRFYGRIGPCPFAIDQIRLWKKARTTKQIKGYIHRLVPPEHGQLVGLWAMDEGFGSGIYDSTPNRLHGQLRSGKWRVPETKGPQGSGLHFSGLDQVVHLKPVFDLRSAWTLEFWYWCDAMDRQGPILSTEGPLVLFRDGTDLWIRFKKGHWVVRNCLTPAIGQHVALTCSHVSAVPDVYVNGGSQDLESSSLPEEMESANALAGYHPNRNTTMKTGRCTLNEIRFWKTTRSKAEIQKHMAGRVAPTSSGLNVYLRLDENTGKDLHNKVDGSVVGTLYARGDNPLPLWVGLPVPSASFRFDGRCEYVEVESANVSDAIKALTSDYTLMAWVRPERFNGLQNVVCKAADVANITFALALEGDRLRFDSVTEGQTFTAVGGRIDEGWSHVAVVVKTQHCHTATMVDTAKATRKVTVPLKIDKKIGAKIDGTQWRQELGKLSDASVTGDHAELMVPKTTAATLDFPKVQLFINGQLVLTTVAHISPKAHDGPLLIGCGNSSVALNKTTQLDQRHGFFYGKMSEVALFGRAFGQEELQKSMNRGIQPQALKLLALWHFGTLGGAARQNPKLKDMSQTSESHGHFLRYGPTDTHYDSAPDDQPGSSRIPTLENSHGKVTGNAVMPAIEAIRKQPLEKDTGYKCLRLDDDSETLEVGKLSLPGLKDQHRFTLTFWLRQEFLDDDDLTESILVLQGNNGWWLFLEPVSTKDRKLHSGSTHVMSMRINGTSDIAMCLPIQAERGIARWTHWAIACDGKTWTLACLGFMDKSHEGYQVTWDGTDASLFYQDGPQTVLPTVKTIEELKFTFRGGPCELADTRFFCRDLNTNEMSRLAQAGQQSWFRSKVAPDSLRLIKGLRGYWPLNGDLKDDVDGNHLKSDGTFIKGTYQLVQGTTKRQRAWVIDQQESLAALPPRTTPETCKLLGPYQNLPEVSREGRLPDFSPLPKLRFTGASAVAKGGGARVPRANPDPLPDVANKLPVSSVPDQYVRKAINQAKDITKQDGATLPAVIQLAQRLLKEPGGIHFSRSDSADADISGFKLVPWILDALGTEKLEIQNYRIRPMSDVDTPGVSTKADGLRINGKIYFEGYSHNLHSRFIQEMVHVKKQWYVKTMVLLDDEKVTPADSNYGKTVKASDIIFIKDIPLLGDLVFKRGKLEDPFPGDKFFEEKQRLKVLSNVANNVDQIGDDKSVYWVWERLRRVERGQLKLSKQQVKDLEAEMEKRDLERRVLVSKTKLGFTVVNEDIPIMNLNYDKEVMEETYAFPGVNFYGFADISQSTGALRYLHDTFGITGALCLVSLGSPVKKAGKYSGNYVVQVVTAIKTDGIDLLQPAMDLFGITKVKFSATTSKWAADPKKPTQQNTAFNWSAWVHADFSATSNPLLQFANEKLGIEGVLVTIGGSRRKINGKMTEEVKLLAQTSVDLMTTVRDVTLKGVFSLLMKFFGIKKWECDFQVELVKKGKEKAKAQIKVVNTIDLGDAADGSPVKFIHKLFGVKTLVVTMVMTPAELMIDVTVSQNKKIGKIMTLLKTALRMELVFSPLRNFFGLAADAELQVAGDTLRLQGVFGFETSVGGVSIEGQLALLGRWENPFGFQGLVVSDLIASLGVSLKTPYLNSIGLAGRAEMGRGTVDLALYIDKTEPNRTGIHAAGSKLNLVEVIDTLTGPDNTVPEDFVDTLGGITLKDFQLSAVPPGGTLGSMPQNYEEGITILSNLDLWGWQSLAYLRVDYSDGVTGLTSIDPIGVAGVMTIGKPKNLTPDLPKPPKKAYVTLNKGPLLYLRVTPYEAPLVYMGASVTLFDQVGEDLHLFINDGGMTFKRQQALGDGLFQAILMVRMKLPAKGQLTSLFIRAELQADFFEQMAQKVRAELRKLAKAATEKIDDAKERVEALFEIVCEKRREVRREREAALRAFRRARRKVEEAERAVDDIHNEINSTKAYWDSLPAVDWPNNPSKARDGVWIWPKLAGLYIALGAARAALEVVKASLGTVENLVQTIPIDADPRVAVPLAAYHVADASLDALKATIGAVAKLGQAFLSMAMAEFFDVRYALFESEFGVADPRNKNAVRFVVDMQARVVLLGREIDMEFRADLHQLNQSAKHLAAKLTADYLD